MSRRKVPPCSWSSTLAVPEPQLGRLYSNWNSMVSSSDCDVTQCSFVMMWFSQEASQPVQCAEPFLMRRTAARAFSYSAG